MRSILISIKPQWVTKILNGEKTIEVRKTAPNCWLPIEVYIYCTKGKPNLWLPYEFGLDNASQPYSSDKPLFDIDTKMNGKIVAKFTLLSIERFGMAYPYEEPNYRFLEKACVTVGEARKYAGGEHPCYKPLYAWHIEDLEIFDEPKELDEFYLNEAPQSWCYVEDRV